MSDSSTIAVKDPNAGSYRWRTKLRGELPSFLSRLVPKGKRDCENHEWYRSEPHRWRCYHCEVGVTDANPFSEAEQMMLERAQVLGEALDLGRPTTRAGLEATLSVDVELHQRIEDLIQRERKLIEQRHSTEV